MTFFILTCFFSQQFLLIFTLIHTQIQTHMNIYTHKKIKLMKPEKEKRDIEPDNTKEGGESGEREEGMEEEKEKREKREDQQLI